MTQNCQMGKMLLFIESLKKVAKNQIKRSLDEASFQITSLSLNKIPRFLLRSDEEHFRRYHAGRGVIGSLSSLLHALTFWLAKYFGEDDGVTGSMGAGENTAGSGSGRGGVAAALSAVT